MATNRPFAYNPSQTPIAGCIQVGDLAVGRPTGGFSSTGLTWWGGPDEDLGIIIAYSQPSGDHPTPLPGQFASLGFKRTTESAFVGFVNNYYNAGVTTPAQAKTWLNANGYWTSWGDIVTTNLTLKLDAADSASYPGSGNSWIDLVNPQQNITLVNAPTYTASAPSYFTFNGSNQYGTGTGTVLGATSYTKSVWFYLNAYVDNNIISSAAGSHYMFFQGGNKMYNGHANWPGFPSNYPSTATFSLNTWYNVALTFNTTDGMKLYINGNLDSSYTAIKTAATGNGSTNIACYSPGGNLFNGRVAKVYCYDRSLTASEVSQNWNADKSKFGY